jgi:hypothetical protein
MSIVIEYYPIKGSKTDLVNFFISEGFSRCDYFLKPFPKGTTYLNWFESEDYKSLDGLEAVIYPDKEKAESGWCVFTRTRVWASAYDRQKQNEVIKKARKLFGGNFYNDSQGKNKYIKIETTEFLTPSESGIFQVYERVKSQLSKLSLAISDHEEKYLLDPNIAYHKDVIKLTLDNL